MTKTNNKNNKLKKFKTQSAREIREGFKEMGRYDMT